MNYVSIPGPRSQLRYSARCGRLSEEKPRGGGEKGEKEFRW